MTSTIYKFEYRQGIVVVTFSAAMLWKQDYAHAASATAISSEKCGVAAAQYKLCASICRPRSVYMKLLYA